MTTNIGIEYNHHLDVELTGYSSFVWARDLDDRKSTIRYAFSIGSIIML